MRNEDNSKVETMMCTTNLESICLRVCFLSVLIMCNAERKEEKNGRQISKELALRNYLFNPDFHHPGMFPRIDVTDDVTIDFEWRLVSLMRMSEKDSEMLLSGTVDLFWKDDFLFWSRREYGGLGDIVVKGEEIWTPQLSVRNRLDVDIEDDLFEDKLMQVTHTGDVSVSFTEKFSTACYFDPTQFPFDCQKCHIILVFNTYSSKKLKIRPKKIKRDRLEDKLFGVWGIEDTVLKVKTRKNRKTSEVFITFLLKRYPYYYVLNIVAPATVLSILSILVYFIPSEQGEKISCGMTIFLSFVVFIITLGDILPETSSSMPVIGVYFMLLMISSTIITIQSIIESFRIHQYNNQPQNKPQPRSEKECSKRCVFSTAYKYIKGNRNWGKYFDCFCITVSIALIIVANLLILDAYRCSKCDESETIRNGTVTTIHGY